MTNPAGVLDGILGRKRTGEKEEEAGGKRHRLATVYHYWFADCHEVPTRRPDADRGDQVGVHRDIV